MWFFLKLVVFLFVYVWLRATLPRFRYDQLMDLGWKKLIPVALFWLLLVAALRMAASRVGTGPSSWPAESSVGGLGWLALAPPCAWASPTAPTCPMTVGQPVEREEVADGLLRRFQASRSR